MCSNKLIVMVTTDMYSLDSSSKKLLFAIHIDFYRKSQPIESQNCGTKSQWILHWKNYSTPIANGILLEIGLKDWRSNRMRQIFVTFCFLIMSEATTMHCHQHDYLNMGLKSKIPICTLKSMRKRQGFNQTEIIAGF